MVKLNDIWGYGQLFGYSAVEGLNRYYDDFVGTLTANEIEIRFEFKEWVKLNFAVNGVKFRAVMSDFIDAETADGDFFLTFADCDTLVGISPVKPVLIGEKELLRKTAFGVELYYNDNDCFGVVLREENGFYKFCIRHAVYSVEARANAKYYLNIDIDALKKRRYAYYEDMPKCKDERYEKLYYKALSVNKVNVRSAEGRIPCTYTTPDRVPHRHMWLWDSVFHALGLVTYNKEVAKDAIRAVLAQQREDGFIPCTMTPSGGDDVTQPQVLSWGVWEVYQKTGDKEFLKESVNALDKYLTWDMKNRDVNGNGLLEWFTEPDYKVCKCGESGLDNSPRFDFDEEMDAVDFSTFLANDALYLSYIYNELGNGEKCEKWNKVYLDLKEKINALMYDEVSGAYYDRLFNGKLTGVITPMSFLPLLAKIPTKEQASKMVKTLTDKNLLWTEVPLSSISKNHPTYSTDMWRGATWLNVNYFIMKGLKNYGYTEIATEIKEKTLKAVNKWYNETGCIFEFYDSADKISPFYCDRKGKQPQIPDWRKHVHSISDYNWSACFTLLMIQNEI